MDFKCSIDYKVDKKVDLYTYSFQSQVHIENILIKLIVCFLFKLSEKHNEIWSKKLTTIW